jgi:hypothetical protein
MTTNPAAVLATATATATVPLLLLALPLAAQRPDATFEHQKRATTITYGAVPVGQHSLAELQVGQAWRMGMNEASTWRLDMPLVAGDKVIAPGAYRVQLQRTGETTAELLANGSGRALGGNGDGQVPGQIGKAGKPAKKLAVEWRKKGAAAHGNQPAQVAVQFGEHEWLGDVTVIGGKELKLGGGWKAVAFTVPAEVLAAGPAAVATLERGDQRWNVVLGKDSVKLVPWMQAPTESFGFGEVKGPDESATTTGKVEPLEQKVDKPWPVLEVLSAKAEKGEVRLELAHGTEAVRVTLPEPKGKK